MSTKLPAIDTKMFWRALGMRAVGGAVVTARDNQAARAFSPSRSRILLRIRRR
jgi:hypothetical protein